MNIKFQIQVLTKLSPRFAVMDQKYQRVDQKTINRMLSILNDTDSEAFKKQLQVSEFLWNMEAASGIGNSMRPWRNDYTIYSKHPKFEEIKTFITQVDPEAIVTFNDGNLPIRNVKRDVHIM